MLSLSGWQEYSEASALAVIGDQLQGAAMGSDDVIAHGQAEAGSPSLVLKNGQDAAASRHAVAALKEHFHAAIEGAPGDVQCPQSGMASGVQDA
jgi:hypothetical protein